MKKTAFRSRLFFSYSALIVLSVCVFLGALAFVIAQTGESEARNAQKEAVQADLRQLEAQLRLLDQLASQTMQNAQLISYFAPLAVAVDDENYFDANVLEFIDASSLLATLNGAVSGTAARISVFNLGGDYVSAGTLYETPARIKEALSDKGALRQLLQKLSGSEQRRLILPPGQDPFSTSQNNRLLQVIRPLSSAYVSKIYGIVSVQQDAQWLMRLVPFHESGEGACLLLDEGGNLILPTAPGALTGAAAAAAKGIAPSDTGEVVTGDAVTELGTLTVSVARMDLSGWLLVRAQPKGHLLSAYRGMFLMLALFGLLLIAVLLGVTYLMADRITRPLSRLSDSIERVTLSSIKIEAPALREGETEELVQLDRSFRTMLDRLNNSIGLEMRAYMYALQSQMNPHFLYNTLSVIQAVGQEEGADKSAGMLIKLSAMLRYVTSPGSEAVTLQDEIEHASLYLQLMKVRYEDKFSYEIHADPDALRVKVPRLILQPLCENCFQHGFQSVRPPWNIRVTVQLQGGRFILTVADNGAGISAQQADQITRRIEDSLRDLPGNYPELKLGGMGLVNTVLRLKLQGGEVSYSILQGPGGGTIIQIGGRCA